MNAVTAAFQCIVECQQGVRSFMLIARVDEELAAQLFIQRSARVRLSHIGDLGISVRKKYWGRSIGTHMMQIAIEWARTHGVTKLQLWVRTNNVRAIALYRKLGFIIEGEITQAIKIGNRYFNNYIMGLILK